MHCLPPTKTCLNNLRNKNPLLHSDANGIIIADENLTNGNLSECDKTTNLIFIIFLISLTQVPLKAHHSNGLIQV